MREQKYKSSSLKVMNRNFNIHTPSADALGGMQLGKVTVSWMDLWLSTLEH